MDVFTVRWLQVRKLFTKEDGFGIHKTLGVLALAHYIYRFHQWYTLGHMLFDGSWFTIGCIFVHIGLSTSSMIFHIPNVRNRAAPMIWPEFRLHSIIFAMRSLTIMLYHWYRLVYPIALKYDPRPVIVVLTMALADEVTKMYPAQGSTMRIMPFPDYASESFKKKLNLFYSMSQVYATLEVLVRPTMSYVFMVLFPIQIAAFLMTCVRKSIITAAGWHLWYTVALLSTLVYSIFNNESSLLSTQHLLIYHGGALYFMLRRFTFHNDKYLLWTHIIFAHKIIMVGYI